MSPSEIAVVITCFDLGSTLEEAVNSALSQTAAPAEVVVVDDGSQESFTRQVLARLAVSEPRLRVLRGEHRGVAHARNAGLAATTAPNAVLLDGDDVFEPTYLEQAGTLLEERPDLHFVCCALQAFGRASYRWKPPPYTVADALGRGACGHISTVFRREVWERVGGFDSQLPAYEDVDFWLRALEAGFHGLIIDDALLRYRVRRGSRYHATVVSGEYRRAKELLLDKHLRAATPRGEQVFAALVDFERELSGHTRSLRSNRERLQSDRDEVEAEVARTRQALMEAAISPFEWGTLSQLDDQGQAAESQLEGEMVQAVLDELWPDALPRYSLKLSESDRWPADASSSYELIVLAGALERSADPASLLHRCREALRPEGQLVLAAACAASSGRRRGFTGTAVRTLLCDLFPPERVEVKSYGNLLTCLAVAAGPSITTLPAGALTADDPTHPTVVGATATAPPAGRRLRVGRRIQPLRALPRRTPAAIPRGVILAYHRIAVLHPDTHRLCTPPENFASQLELVRERYRPISLSDLTAHVRAGTLPTGSVGVTFDDGYLDNLEVASPILTQLEVPATFFLGGCPPQTPSEAWWDTAERILLGGEAVPDRLVLDVGSLRLDLASGTPSERRVVLQTLHGQLLDAPPDVVWSCLDALRSWSGLTLPVRETHRLMTADEVLELAERPAHAIGAHGRNHRLLARQPRGVQAEELGESKRELEQLLGRPVELVAYPYGACNDVTAGLAAEAGFTAGCTVEADPVTLDSDVLRLPRLEVHDEDLAGFAFQLEQALSSPA